MNLAALKKQLEGGGQAKAPPKGDPRKAAFKAFAAALRDENYDEAEAALAAWADDSEED